MAETQVQSKDVEEVDDEEDPSDDKVFMDLRSGMGYIQGVPRAMPIRIGAR
jgi:hypothetical protein